MRAIGVSNFLQRHLEELVTSSKIVPAVLQVSAGDGSPSVPDKSIGAVDDMYISWHCMVAKFNTLGHLYMYYNTVQLRKYHCQNVQLLRLQSQLTQIWFSKFLQDGNERCTRQLGCSEFGVLFRSFLTHHRQNSTLTWYSKTSGTGVGVMASTCRRTHHSALQPRTTRYVQHMSQIQYTTSVDSSWKWQELHYVWSLMHHQGD